MKNFTTYNFSTLISGSYFAGAEFTLWSDEAKTAPLDIQGAEIVMSLRPAFNLPVAWVFSNGVGSEGEISITDGENGQFSILGTNMDLEPGKYVYDISILLYTGELKKFLRGEWIFLPTAE